MFQKNQIIKKNDTLKLNVIYKPTPSRPSLKEKIIIQTEDEEYLIELTGKAYHIDYTNAEKISNFK